MYTISDEPSNDRQKLNVKREKKFLLLSLAAFSVSPLYYSLYFYYPPLEPPPQKKRNKCPKVKDTHVGLKRLCYYAVDHKRSERKTKDTHVSKRRADNSRQWKWLRSLTGRTTTAAAPPAPLDRITRPLLAALASPTTRFIIPTRIPLPR